MSTDEARFDLLLPIEIPTAVSFDGASSRGNIGLNGDVGFILDGYQCSFHKINKRSYVIVRLACLETEAAKQLEWVCGRIKRAAAWLDVSMRISTSTVEFLPVGSMAQLAHVNFFPAGENPRVITGEATFQIGVSADYLSKAFQKRATKVASNDQIFDLFNDVDFEHSATSQFVILTTILEMLAVRRERDLDTKKMIVSWAAEAVESKDENLAAAILNLKLESASSAMTTLVNSASKAAGCDEIEQQQYSKRVKLLYSRRSAVLHHGRKVTKSDLEEVRKLVRLVIFNVLDDGVFTKVPRFQ